MIDEFGMHEKIYRMNQLIREDTCYKPGMKVLHTGSGYDLYLSGSRHQTPESSAMLSCVALQAAKETRGIANTTDYR